MSISAEDQIIHYLKDKIGLAKADELVAVLKLEQARADSEKLRELHRLERLEASLIDYINHDSTPPVVGHILTGLLALASTE
ncbi:hypothetical protein [Streptomyces bauhiniae]|uniref:Uncharacterized protein n=1 Tax=Streptomyces bauhiniae TaxID=2340725 RepID=A0A7K3QR91_9ACTN|nr:hypothetical protein [Streptomyces bauhiniae]NEB92417.1 hypothetical protein [Streptomyces bauhiniae]